MEWKEARRRISDCLIIGTKIDIADAELMVAGTYRDGYEIQMRGSEKVNLKWFVLEHCWKKLIEGHVFDKGIFGNLFGDDCLGNHTYVDIVGRIFMKAGLVKLYENTYHDYKENLFRQLCLQLLPQPQNRQWQGEPERASR